MLPPTFPLASGCMPLDNGAAAPCCWGRVGCEEEIGSCTCTMPPCTPGLRCPAPGRCGAWGAAAWALTCRHAWLNETTPAMHAALTLPCMGLWTWHANVTAPDCAPLPREEAAARECIVLPSCLLRIHVAAQLSAAATAAMQRWRPDRSRVATLAALIQLRRRWRRLG